MSKYYLETMPHVNKALERVEAWYHQEITDRVPIRFSEHNGIHSLNIDELLKKYDCVKDYWFDADFQVDYFLETIKNTPVYAETFPVFYPNLGPCVYASYYGISLKYGKTTSWAQHMIDDLSQFKTEQLKLNKESETWKKIDDITDIALKKGKNYFFTGYTDLHPSLDCAADFMGVENLCIAMLDAPEKVINLVDRAYADFPEVYEYYQKRLEGQPSVSWMGIPSVGTMHIPSCDFSAMLSTEQFEQFALPYILKEVKHFEHNIFHLDGRGVARHLDVILSIPEIQAIQWVQGVGDDEPIMQWIPLIQKIQAAGKSVVVGLKAEELPAFMREVSPKGIYLTMPVALKDQPDIVKLVENWK